MARSKAKTVAQLRDRILPRLTRTEPPSGHFDYKHLRDDIADLHAFVRANCGGAGDSQPFREALLLLQRLQHWGPYWDFSFSDRPGPVKFSADGTPYLHHSTLQGEDTGGRPRLIAGGAFEMNRRRH